MRSLALLLLLTANENAPMQPVTAFVEALQNADLDALAAAFADDATVFMPMPSIPKRVEGKAAIREAFAAPFAQLRASDKKPPYFRLEPRDLQTTLHGDVAVITFHLGTAAPGTSFSRRTFVVTRQGDRWRIAHFHASNMTQ